LLKVDFMESQPTSPLAGLRNRAQGDPRASEWEAPAASDHKAAKPRENPNRQPAVEVKPDI
jgi:hypothetical protein